MNILRNMDTVLKDFKLNKIAFAFVLLSTIFIALPPAPLRIMGWIILSYFIFKEIRIGIILAFLFSVFFEDVGIFHIGFTLKPFQIFVLLIMSSYLFKLAKRELKIPKFSLMEFMLICFLIIFFISSILAEDNRIGNIRIAVNLSLPVLFCLFVPNILKEKTELIIAINAFITGLLILGIYTVIYSLKYANWYISDHGMGNLAIIAIAILMGLFLYYFKSNRVYWFIFSIITMYLYLLVYSGSRSSWITFFTVIFWFLLLRIKYPVNMLRICICLAVLVYLFFIIDLYISEVTAKRFIPLIHGTYHDLKLKQILKVEPHIDSSLIAPPHLPSSTSKPVEHAPLKNLPYTKYILGKERLDGWNFAVAKVKEHPIFGVGFRSIGIGINNLFFEFLAGIGILGFGCFILFILAWFWDIVKVMRNSNDDYLVALAIGLSGSLIGWMISSLSETYFLQFHIWTFLTLGISIYKLVFCNEIRF